MLPRRLALLAAGLLLTAPLHAVTPASAEAAPVAAPVEKVVAKKKAKDPRKRLGLFVDPRMPAAQQGSAYQPIARQPQALWFTDYYATGSVAGAARDYLGRAKAARKTPMMVVYAIPGRDCGQHSAGGLRTPAAYKKWVRQVAKGIKRSQAKPLLILEPDAIGFYADNTSCAGTRSWPALLSYASRTLTKAGAWVYLDSAHSNWSNANGGVPGRAALLKRSGIRWARGFSTNVSNFRTTAAEQAYANTLLRELRKVGVKGKKYVVDTSRNGRSGGPLDGRVINPTWARLGAAPKLRFKGAFDGTLWVKHPGESDGPECGGPSSGQWSNLLADRLLGRVPDGGC
ncbi:MULTISPECIES: glycoside hydrolase family 6 protein [unclassified Nocardioides]|uniref:glycoside hydrolase family 6 protein n=1 Tax=unclassified Nocardioides TaxID=2615069 RepID=UPI0030149D57